MAQTKAKRQSKPPSRKHVDSDADSDDDELTQSQDASQSVSHKTIENVVRKQQEQAKARRAQREQEIEAHRKHRLAKVQQKMDECRRNHRASIEGIRKPKIDRLRALLAKKRDLEAELDRCLAQVNEWQRCTIQQVQVAVDARFKALAD